MQLNIPSETDRLKGVIVHTPGREVSLLNPEIKDDLLFDDIIFEEDARSEHLDMLEVFRVSLPEGGMIYEITDLIQEVFEQEEARSYFIQRFKKQLPETHVHIVEDQLVSLSGDELLQFAVEGFTEAVKGFSIPPIPNLLFTRDLAAVVGDGIILSQAAKKARIRETLLMETLVMHHELFSAIRPNVIRIPFRESIEGGDILVASDEVVLIGMSERSSFSGSMKAAEGLFKRGIKHVLIVDIPKQRSSMHLDTIFTFASPDECIVFPPAISEREDNVVALSHDGDKIVAEMQPSVQQALETFLKRPVTFINCGGDDRTNQFREQWTDGANVFALAPGIIVGYERNTNTFNTLKAHGYELMNQYDFIEEYRNKEFKPEAGKKIAISFRGHELCRGRGGARCMTLPISRVS